jgi:hypothetical protein
MAHRHPLPAEIFRQDFTFSAVALDFSKEMWDFLNTLAASALINL